MRFSVRPEDAAPLDAQAARRAASMRVRHSIVCIPARAPHRAAIRPSVSAEVAERLRAQLGAPMLVTGARGEGRCVEQCARGAAACRRDTICPARSTLGELAALIERARVLVSNNSGPVHLASALGTPVVDLYALTNPQHTPWQTPHRVLFHDVPCRWCYRSVCPAKTSRVPASASACDRGACRRGCSELIEASIHAPRRARPMRSRLTHVHTRNQCRSITTARRRSCATASSLAAAEDERFTHVKHAKRPVPFSTWQLPFDAIDYCLKEAGITLADVDHVALFVRPAALFGGMPSACQAPRIELPFDPGQHAAADPSASPWDPLFLSYIVNATAQLLDGAPHHLQASASSGVDRDAAFRMALCRSSSLPRSERVPRRAVRRHRRADAWTAAAKA